MPSVRSQCDMVTSQHPTIRWSQRALPASDIMVKGEGLYLDSSHNKSASHAPSNVSVTNGKLGAAVGSGGGSAGPTRSYLQTTIGAKMARTTKEQQGKQRLEVSGKSVGRDHNFSHGEDADKGQQPAQSASGCTSSWTWDSVCDNVALDPYVEKKDQEIFHQCREHLDAINLSTQLQQVINDEMRSQAELDQMVYDCLKAKTQRLAKQTGLGDGDWDRTWINTAFSDLRKCVKEQAHAHSAYSQTLLSQSTAIQQSLDSHKKLMEKTKRALASPDVDGNWKGSARPGASMSFVQATCEFEKVYKPRLKLISELDFLSTQIKSLDQQLQDIELLLLSIKDSDSTAQGQWRFQHRLEEARTRQDFLRSRRAQLQGEIKAVGAELKDFHLRYRERMTIVLNVFRQHRDRCDSTLRKSISLLRAASQSDREVLKTLDAHKKTQLSPEEEPYEDSLPPTDSLTEIETPSFSDNVVHQTHPNSSEQRGTTGQVMAGDLGSGDSRGEVKVAREEGVLKREPTVDRNPLKPRKVSFKEMQSVNSELRQGGSHAENDTTGNHSNQEDDTDSESTAVERSVNKPGGKKKTGGVDEGNTFFRSSGRPTVSETKKSYFTFHSLDGDESPTKSPKTDRDQSIENQNSSGSKPVLKSNSTQKTRIVTSEASSRDVKLCGKTESTGKTSKNTTVENAKRADEPVEGCPKPKIARQPFSRTESKKVSAVQRDVSGIKSKESKAQEGDKLQTNARVKREQPSITASGNASGFSGDSRTKLSPVRSVAQSVPMSPSSNRTENSANRSRDHDVDSDGAASGSDSEPNDAGSSKRMSRKAQLADKSRCAGMKSRQAKSEEPSDLCAEVKSPVLVSGKPPTSHTKLATHVSRSRETSTSSDIRRRVAFSDQDVNSGQVSEVKSRASSASGSQVRTSGQDRGILKKPSDSNSSVKSVTVREENATKTRIRLDDRSHGSHVDGTPVSNYDGTHTQQEKTTQGDQDRRVSRPQGKFIPEVSESSQSHSSVSSSESSSADEKGGKGGVDPWLVEKMKQLEIENIQLQNFMKEQKRIRDEEERMNRLISKYANTRRGLGGLSMNYNNSETTVPSCGEMFKDSLSRMADGTIVEGGRADILQFDADTNRQDDDSGCNGTAPQLVETSRQLKVCAVRPIPTDASDFNQNENPGERASDRNALSHQSYGPTPDTVTKRAINQLKEFEITAGQFVELSYEGESTKCASSSEERQGELSVSSTGFVGQMGKPNSKRVKCEWSAQKYGDSQTDLNNNLSSTGENVKTDVSNEQHTHPCVNPSPLLDVSREVLGRQSCARNKRLEPDHILLKTELLEDTLNLARKNKSSEHSRCCQSPPTVLNQKDKTSPLEPSHSREIATTASKDVNLVSCCDTEEKDKPWNYDTGFECYTAEEKLALLDSGLLCDTNEGKGTLTADLCVRPLKSCLKRRICGRARSPTEPFDDTDARTHSQTCFESNQRARCRHCDDQSATEGLLSLRACDTQQQNDFARDTMLSFAHMRPPKRVQFSDPIHCCYTHDAWVLRRSHDISPAAGFQQLDACDLNLSNNSSSADCLRYSDCSTMDWLKKLQGELWPRPLTGRILVSLSKQNRIWDWFKTRAQRDSVETQQGQSTVITVLRTINANEDCQTRSCLCMVNSQTDSLIHVVLFILPRQNY